MSKKRPEGWECRDESEGVTKCQRIEIDEQGQKIATGTEFGVGVDPNTCEPYYTGDMSIMDRDEKKVQSIVKKKVSSCKRGL